MAAAALFPSPPVGRTSPERRTDKQTDVLESGEAGPPPPPRLHQISLTLTEAKAGGSHTHTHTLSPACDYGEQKPCEQHGCVREHQWDTRAPAAPHNSAATKGEVCRRGLTRAGCYLTDERRRSSAAAPPNRRFPAPPLSRLPKYDKRRT